MNSAERFYHKNLMDKFYPEGKLKLDSASPQEIVSLIKLTNDKSKVLARKMNRRNGKPSKRQAAKWMQLKFEFQQLKDYHEKMEGSFIVRCGKRVRSVLKF